MLLLQEKILGVLLGARLGSNLASEGKNLGLQMALRDLEKLAAQPVKSAAVESILPLLSESKTDSAEILLAILPIVFLGFADPQEMLADRIVRAAEPWIDSTEIQNEVLHGALAMAKLLRAPLLATVPQPLAGTASPSKRSCFHSTALQALQRFCEAPNDYRSCLQRAARLSKTTSTSCLTGAFLGAYQGVLCIPLPWQLALACNGTWSQYECLARAAVAEWAGQGSGRERLPTTVPIVGPTGSLQKRARAQMPSWEQN